MLEKITWTQYSLSLLAILILYYGVVLAKHFRSEIRNLAAHFRSKLSRMKESPPLVESLQGEVMGKPKAAPGITYCASDQIRFASAPPIADPDSLLGQIPEVLQEFRSICDLLEKENGGRDDLAFLLETLRLRYHLLEQSPHLPSLLENLREQLPFPLTKEELLALWQPA